MLGNVHVQGGALPINSLWAFVLKGQKSVTHRNFTKIRWAFIQERALIRERRCLYIYRSHLGIPELLLNCFQSIVQLTVTEGSLAG